MLAICNAGNGNFWAAGTLWERLWNGSALDARESRPAGTPWARLIAVLLAVALVASPSVALAESRTPPEATAHALDELANCRAQQRPECPTETATATPTSTPSPTSTSTPVPPPSATETSTTPTLEPCWLADQDLGDPDNGYIVFDEDGAPVPCIPDQPSPTDEPTPTSEPTVASTETPVPVHALWLMQRATNLSPATADSRLCGYSVGQRSR